MVPDNNAQKNTFYVTTPIYYVNAKPHLGSLYSTVLADVAARWHAMCGQEVFFLTGTDEHGQKVAEAAAAAGKAPQAFVDGLVGAFQGLFDRYNCDYSIFMRTTSPFHIKAVQGWIERLLAQGDIYKATYEGWYCSSQEAFLTEKDLEFVAAGEPPVSCFSGKPARWVSEECYFFKLSAYQERLLAFYKEHPSFVTPAERLQEVIAFVSHGLKDLAISRKTITWGIPFPGDASQVTYVWADALNNYITAVGYGDKTRAHDFAKWWPADVHIMGKDIVRFHAVYWPAFLMATGLEIPRTLLVHGWIKVGDQKMSKSLGNVIDPEELLLTYGADPLRYYLTRYLAITQDAPFNKEELELRINADLANDFGNLVNRVLALAHKQGFSKISLAQLLEPKDKQLIQLVQTCFAEAEQEMSRYYFHQAYAAILRLVAGINRYFHETEPWKVVKTDSARFEAIIATTCAALYGATLALWPVMPESMEKVLAVLGVPFERGHDYYAELRAGKLAKSFELGTLEPLFKKIEREDMNITIASPEAKIEETDLIALEDLLKVELCAGTITAVDDVAGSEKMYKMTVDLGPIGVRTVCAGVKKSFAIDQLVGVKTIFVANLKPRSLMGVQSQGMMLVAPGKDGASTLVHIDQAVENGTRLR